MRTVLFGCLVLALSCVWAVGADKVVDNPTGDLAVGELSPEAKQALESRASIKKMLWDAKLPGDQFGELMAAIDGFGKNTLKAAGMGKVSLDEANVTRLVDKELGKVLASAGVDQALLKTHIVKFVVNASALQQVRR